MLNPRYKMVIQITVCITDVLKWSKFFYGASISASVYVYQHTIYFVSESWGNNKFTLQQTMSSCQSLSQPERLSIMQSRPLRRRPIFLISADIYALIYIYLHSYIHICI